MDYTVPLLGVIAAGNQQRPLTYQPLADDGLQGAFVKMLDGIGRVPGSPIQQDRDVAYCGEETVKLHAVGLKSIGGHWPKMFLSPGIQGAVQQANLVWLCHVFCGTDGITIDFEADKQIRLDAATRPLTDAERTEGAWWFRVYMDHLLAIALANGVDVTVYTVDNFLNRLTALVGNIFADLQFRTAQWTGQPPPTTDGRTWDEWLDAQRFVPDKVSGVEPVAHQFYCPRQDSTGRWISRWPASEAKWKLGPVCVNVANRQWWQRRIDPQPPPPDPELVALREEVARLNALIGDYREAVNRTAEAAADVESATDRHSRLAEAEGAARDRLLS